MTDLRVALLPASEPLRARPATVHFADVALRPLRRGLLFLAALSLPVLGCVAADRFHGSQSGTTQVAAVPHNPPRIGAAAISLASAQARLAAAKFGQSLSLR